MQWEEATGKSFGYDKSREPSASIRADIVTMSERAFAMVSARCYVSLITELPSLFEQHGFKEVTTDDSTAVEPAWLKTWHRLTMMSMQMIARMLERAGDSSYWELLNRVDAASKTDEGTYLYYQPASTVGRKPAD